jgi:HAD superfamily hydrolase (TIGR01549 family)
MPRVIENVLLDVDGTLLDSNEAHARAWVAILADHGITIPLARMRLLIGMGGDKILAHLTNGGIGEEEAEQISRERDELFLERYLAGVKAFPGVREFALALHTAGLRIILATSANQKLLEEFQRILGIEDFVYGVTTASDADASKPSPDILEAGIRRFALDQNRTVMVGDTPYDIEAARRVPCPSIAVRSGGFPAYMLDLADEVYDDIQDLTRNLQRSILTR